MIDISDMLSEVLGVLSPVETTDEFSKYHDDPVGFCIDILDEKYLTEDTKKLMMSVAFNRVTLGKSGNALGKSFSAARIAIWFFLCRRGQVYLAAAPPLSNLTNILFGEIFSIVGRHEPYFEMMNQRSMHIQRSPDHFLTGVSIPSSGTKEQRIGKFSGKHHKNGVLFIFDEASACPDEVFAGAETCASDDASRICAIFNPHSRSGWTYRAERDGQANIVSLSAFNHIQVVTGRDDITPGAVTRNTTLLRINQWCRPLHDGEKSGSGTFVLPEFLAGVDCIDQQGSTLPGLPIGSYKIVEPQFSTVVLGEYPAAGTNSLINQEWIDAARTRYDNYVVTNGEIAPEYVKANVGADIAEMGNDSTVLCFRYGGFVFPLVSWDQCELPETERKIVVVCEGEDIARILVDGTGLGAGVAPHLQEKHLPAIKVMVASSPTETSEFGDFKLLNDQLAWAVRLWLQGDTAMLPPDEMLIEELAAYTYQIGDDGKLRVSKKSVIKDLLRRSPDRFDSLKLTFYTEGAADGYDLS